MANRWIEFVKNYAKEQNISYTCAMCEIKTKNLYKPLKKEANREEEPKIFTIKTKKTNPKEEEEKKTKQKNDEIFRLEAKLEELIKIYETAYLSDTMVYALTGRRRPKTVANPFDKNKAFSEYEKTLNELKLITDKKYKTLKEIFKPPTKKQEKDANDREQEGIIKKKKEEEERYNIMTQKEKNLYNLYNSLTPIKKKKREGIIENPKKMEEKENLIKIDKVRQKLNDEKKQILNDIEKILKKPKRRKSALLEPEITYKNAEEIGALNYAKKRLEINEITFNHCLKNIEEHKKELEELLKERNTENFKAMKRTNPRFMQVLNQIDFYERAIYKCQNALMGIFNNY
jgi:hypothetical protein